MDFVYTVYIIRLVVKQKIEIPEKKPEIRRFPFYNVAGIVNTMVRLLAFGFFIIFSLLLGDFTSVEAQGTGTLSVTTIPVSGAIYVDNLLVGLKFWSGDLIAGSHVVSFGDADGYIAPSQQTVTIIADQTYYVVGAYRKLLSWPESAERPALEAHTIKFMKQ